MNPFTCHTIKDVKYDATAINNCLPEVAAGVLFLIYNLRPTSYLYTYIISNVSDTNIYFVLLLTFTI